MRRTVTFACAVTRRHARNSDERRKKTVKPSEYKHQDLCGRCSRKSFLIECADAEEKCLLALCQECFFSPENRAGRTYSF